jgi:uncharacterized protein (TIRG00374 family)
MPPAPRGREGRLRKAFRLIVGIAVSVACLWLAFRDTNWTYVADELRKTSPGWVGAVVLASLAAVYIRAQRWRILLRPLGDVPLYPALSATAIGFGASSVLPLRLGELLRPALLGRRTGVRMSAALSSVVIERLFDVLLVISCFLAVSVIYPQVPPDMRRGAVVLAGLATTGFVVLLLMQRHRPAAERVMGRVVARLPRSIGPRLHGLIESFLDGLEGLGDLRTVLRVLGYSAYLWGVITLTFLFSFLALDIRVPLVAASLTTVVIVAAAVFLPQGPGFVGTWQVGCVMALRFFGVPHHEAGAFSIVTWVVQMAVNVTVAALFLAREGLTVRELMHVAPSDTPPAEAEG